MGCFGSVSTLFLKMDNLSAHFRFLRHNIFKESNMDSNSFVYELIFVDTQNSSTIKSIVQLAHSFTKILKENAETDIHTSFRH